MTKENAVKFRARPVVVEAMQLKEQTAWEELISFCPGAVSQSGHRAMIPTTKGQMIADVGDWIIKDVTGEFYPCKPDVFETTYEPVGVDVKQTDEVELQRDGLALVLKKVASLLTTTKESPQWTRVDFDYMVQNIRAVLATSDFRTIGQDIRTLGDIDKQGGSSEDMSGNASVLKPVQVYLRVEPKSAASLGLPISVGDLLRVAGTVSERDEKCFWTVTPLVSIEAKEESNDHRQRS